MQKLFCPLLFQRNNPEQVIQYSHKLNKNLFERVNRLYIMLSDSTQCDPILANENISDQRHAFAYSGHFISSP